PILRPDAVHPYVFANDIQFSSDGRHLATAGHRLAHVWDLTPEAYTLPQWQVISEAFGGQRLTARGELEFLTPVAFSNAWHIAHAQFPALFANTDEQVIDTLFFNARDAG